MRNSLIDIYNRYVETQHLQSDPAQLAVLDELEHIRSQLEKAQPKRGFFKRKMPTPVQGLYLWGGVGRGKSMMMDLFVEHLDIPEKRRVHFHAFMQEIHSAMHEVRKTGVDDAIAPIATEIAADLRLLAFDEMQITDITDAMIVGRLFEKLFEAGVTVVTTSNRPPDDLYKDGLNRQLFLPFIDLLEQQLKVMELISPTDYRQDRLSGSQVYFTPINAESRAAIDKIWQDMTGGQAAPHHLTVKSRTVSIPAFHNGVARARFHDLCGQPLGPADFLALAAAVRVLVLEDIPQLGRSNFNEAKRFVTLIDALYEAKVRLVASAAASPEMLYIEGEGSFEFERTASRMREMQAEDWGVNTD